MLSRSYLAVWAASGLLEKLCAQHYVLMRDRGGSLRLRLVRGLAPDASSPYTVQPTKPDKAPAVTTRVKLLLDDPHRPEAYRLDAISDAPLTLRDYNAFVEAGLVPARSVVSLLLEEHERVERDYRLGYGYGVIASDSSECHLWGTQATHQVALLVRSWLQPQSIPQFDRATAGSVRLPPEALDQRHSKYRGEFHYLFLVRADSASIVVAS